MPIKGIPQPQILQIDEKLRLRKFDGQYDFALDWYLDVETVYLVDGVREPYDREKLQRMYEYLNEKGELYFIEVWENDRYVPIGHVTFWKEDMPIVIGNKNYRQKGIGKKVVGSLIERGRSLGYDSCLYSSKVYIECS